MCYNTLLNNIKITTLGAITAIILSSCGSGDSGDGNPQSGDSGSSQTGQLVLKVKNKTVPVQNINYSTPSAGNQTTDNSGKFNYKTGEQITFTLAGKQYSTTGQSRISPQTLIPENADTANNLAILLLNLDTDNNIDSGIRLGSEAEAFNPALPEKDFQRQLYNKTGKLPKPIFTPSLGINLEAPQAESDAAGQPMAFADIFRTARPFMELSNSGGTEIEVDENGWPINITPSDTYARTKLLQGVTRGAIPDGVYTVMYEGSGKIDFSGGSIPKGGVAPLPSELKTDGIKGRLLTLAIKQSNDPEANAINLRANGEVKNIRIAMPGGSCKNNSSQKYNLLIRAKNESDCPTGTTYVSFAKRLHDNRNEIIFNPEYLSFLKNFKVIRMMNFMESSPGISSCRDSDGVLDEACVLEETPWSERAKMDDAVWGGSGRTEMRERKGVPVEVLVALANQLEADPWFNIPHYADDDYIEAFAEHVATYLKPILTPYVEYSNETWNSGFIGFHYMQKKGLDTPGYDEVPEKYTRYRDEKFFARLRFYSKRSVDIFHIWEGLFSNRLVRVMGTSQGDTILSEQLLQFDQAPGNVDALAMAPYFLGCIDRLGSCSNAPKILSEITSVDDIFDVIDQPYPTDPSALDATIEKVKRQVSVAEREGVQLITYEGGQHLTIMGSLGKFSEEKKQDFRNLFQAANRDPRMKERYTKLLNAWRGFHDQGATLFTLYTLPQTYYRFGNWGIKEHLGKTRKESPKFDASMSFQEAQGQCWWDDC